MSDQTSTTSPAGGKSDAKKPFYKRPWFIVLAAIVLIGGIANATNNDNADTSEPQATVTVTATPTATPSETPSAEETQAEISPSPEETVKVDSDFNVANFKSRATGNIDDLKKDLSDLRKRAEEGSLFRLLGNVLEVSFNQGQLEALTDVPTKIAKTWPAQMVKLSAAVDALSDKTSAFVAGDANLSSLKDSINKVNGVADKLMELAAKLL